MYNRKLIDQQILMAGVRIGDSCSIVPWNGRKKEFTLNRNRIDLISSKYRPDDLSMSYVELPRTETEPFHYRLELEEKPLSQGRFVLKTIKGHAFLLNGLAAKEAYVERSDRLLIDDNKVNFFPTDLEGLTRTHFDHPVLLEENLLRSSLKILILGETGTGKTHLASRIHQRSQRPGPFVATNLSSYNPQLIESELFGHKKGSFTGATADKAGAFAQAEHGTLFLDEVDSLPWDLQTKLLTFIDNNRFRPVGEVKETEIKTRMVFASGRSLEEQVQKGEFRRDLYFRFKAGHTLELPSLRNDVTKIRSACQFFALEHGISLSHRLLEFYQTLAWPGNLRQLFGHLEKKKILSRSSKLDFDHLDEELLLRSSDLMSIAADHEFLSMAQVKQNYAKTVLSACEGNYNLAAKKLRLTEKTVRSMLGKLQLART